MGVVLLGGRQHLAGVGDVLVIGDIGRDKGEIIEVDNILGFGKLALEVVENIKGKKTTTVKFKKKKGYRRKVGHRQAVSVMEVVAGGKTGVDKLSGGKGRKKKSNEKKNKSD